MQITSLARTFNPINSEHIRLIELPIINDGPYIYEKEFNDTEIEVAIGVDGYNNKINIEVIYYKEDDDEGIVYASSADSSAFDSVYEFVEEYVDVFNYIVEELSQDRDIDFDEDHYVEVFEDHGLYEWTY